MTKKIVNFEKSLKDLEMIVEKLESGEETLENTVKLYQEGMDISERCKKILENAKQKITVLNKI